jgi:hypothetical protein
VQLVNSRINWRGISENDFNTLANALLVREYSGQGTTAHAIDGRGGDGGVDIDVRVTKTDQLTQIFQLKWFPEGFSGTNKGRRRQIKDSFERAMELSPPVWTLVVPADGSPEERKFNTLLRGKRSVRIRFIGITELNLLLAKYPEIHTWHERDQHREALELVHREQNILARPADLSHELSLINSKLAGRSNYWRTDYSVSGDESSESYTPIHPDAEKMEPLSFKFDAVFGPEDEDTRAQFQEMIEYGTSQTVLLPPRIVTSAEKIGPEWFAEALPGASLEISPVRRDEVGESIRLEARTSIGRVVAAVNGRITHVDSGLKGGSLEASFDGGLRQRWKFPNDRAISGTLNFSMQAAGANALDTQRVIRLIETMNSADHLLLRMGDKSERFALDQASKTIPPLDAELVALVDDLTYLNEMFHVDFRIPTAISAEDRLWVRVAKLIQEGKSAVVPGMNSVTFTLDGTIDDGAIQLLTTDSAVFARHEDWTLEILGETLVFEDIAIYHHRAYSVDGEEHAAALRRGEGAGRKVTVQGRDGLGFRIYSFARIAPGSRPPLEPWGVAGIREHKKFEELRLATDAQNATEPDNLGNTSTEIH